MRKTYEILLLIVCVQGLLLSCTSGPKQEKEIPKEKEKESVQQADSSFTEKKSRYAEILDKFKEISFDTLKVFYNYDPKYKQFLGKELTLKETKFLPIEVTANYFGKLSGVYACYRFRIDNSRTGLIARIPGEYDASTIILCIYDREKEEVARNYFYLAMATGDAGEVYSRTSWLYKAKNNQLRSLVYDYESYDYSVDDTLDQRVEEWHKYQLVDCMSPGFDTLTTNNTRLKKQFAHLLRNKD